MHIEEELKLLEKAITHLKLPLKVLGVAHTNDGSQQVEIEYQFDGRHYNSATRSIETRSTHKVKFVFGYGYPHLPPRCYPIDQVFHPAFDQDTIQIQDFWETSKSFIELVLYIGKLISGQKTTVQNPYNLAAVKWYKEHLYELPFSSVNLLYTLNTIMARLYDEVDTKKPEIQNLPLKLSQQPTQQTQIFEYKHKKEPSQWLSYVLFGFMILVVGYCANIVVSYFETTKLNEARLTFSECKTFVEAKRYKEAFELCSTLESDLKYIYKNRKEKMQILEDARKLIVSERVIENLNKPKQQKIQQNPEELFEKKLTEAKIAYANQEYAFALKSYKEASKFTTSQTDLESVENIRSSISELEFLTQLQAEQEKLSLNANTVSSQTFAKLDSLYNNVADKNSISENYENFKKLVSIYGYCRNIIQAYQKNRYAEVQTLYNAISKNEEFFSTADGVAIEILVVKAEVYLKLNIGKKSYEKNDWKTATNAFADSLKALEDLQSKLSILNFSFNAADTKEIDDILRYAKVMYARSAVNYKYALGEVYETKGDRTRARREFSEALIVFENYPSELSNMQNFKKRIEEKIFEIR